MPAMLHNAANTFVQAMQIMIKHHASSDGMTGFTHFYKTSTTIFE